MKNIKLFLFSFFSMILVFVSSNRTVIIALTSANLLSLVCQANPYVDTPSAPTKDDQLNSAATGNTSSASVMAVKVTKILGLVGAVTAEAAESMRGGGKGLEFKDPVLSSGVTYRRMDDHNPGGFGGNEVDGDVSVDADIYDGLIAGVLYQHIYRGAENAVGTSETLNADGVSLYGAKRFFNLLNLGLAYNYSHADHKLNRSLLANLDSDSNGFSMLAGISDRKNQWSWSTTTSFNYSYNDFAQQKDLEMGQFSWGGSLGYDITKEFKLEAAFTYYNFVFQDLFPNSPIPDNDYLTIGPRLSFYPTRNATIHFDFESQLGQNNVDAYMLRLGTDIAF